MYSVFGFFAWRKLMENTFVLIFLNYSIEVSVPACRLSTDGAQEAKKLCFLRRL